MRYPVIPFTRDIAPADNRTFEELCEAVLKYPEGQVLVDAKRARIARAECSPCERAKDLEALRTWLHKRGDDHKTSLTGN